MDWVSCFLSCSSIPNLGGRAALSFGCYARKREGDTQRCVQGPRNRTRHLGTTTEAAAMCNRQLEKAQPSPGRAHLHLEVPAVSHLAHAELLESLATDGTKCAHVGKTDPVEQAHEPARAVPGRDLQRVHAAGLAFAARPRAEHEVVGAGKNRRQQRRHELGPVAAVAVDEYDDGAVTRGTRARCTGAAIATLPFDEDLSARSTRTLDGAILAAAVDHDDLIHHRARDGP